MSRFRRALPAPHSNREGHEVDRGTVGDGAVRDECECLRQRRLDDAVQHADAEPHLRHGTAGGTALDRRHQPLTQADLVHRAHLLPLPVTRRRSPA